MFYTENNSLKVLEILYIHYVEIKDKANFFNKNFEKNQRPRRHFWGHCSFIILIRNN